MLHFTLFVLLLLSAAEPFCFSFHFQRINFLRRQTKHLSATTITSTTTSTSLQSPLLSLRPTVAVIIANDNSISTFQKTPSKENVTWLTVMSQVKEKMSWEKINNAEGTNVLDGLSMEIFTIEQIRQKCNSKESTSAADIGADIIILIGCNDDDISSEDHRKALDNFLEKSKAIVPLQCTGQYYSQLERFGDYSPSNPLEKYLAVIDRVIKTGRRYDDRELKKVVNDLWLRKSSGDILFMALVLVDSFTNINIKSVKSVTSNKSTSFSQLSCMCTNCSKELLACISDPECKAALDCLNGCKGNDQVASYRCITSHETPLFEAFALCILQKNNCMGNTAVAPVYPNPRPMTVFRDEPLTHETAEGIFIGHLAPRQGEFNPLMPQKAEAELSSWSWKVVAGQNPAYDYFSNQHQIFYYDKRGKNTMWYDPVFLVTKLDGTPVWRRRHYRVKRGKEPGEFYFSVLDNGVTSLEYWRIVEAANDLSWAVFYYSGAAVAAGTSYSGALLVTKDGSWPSDTDSALVRIEKAMDVGGIKMWELFEVSNNNVEDSAAGPAPLGHK